MTRIFVAVGRQFDLADLRRELGQPRDDTCEVFVHYDVGGRAIAGGLLRTSRFWRTRHAELDTLLGSITRPGLLSDGIATAGDPVACVDETLREFRPDEVLVGHAPPPRGRAERVRAILRDYAESAGIALRTIERRASSAS